MVGIQICITINLSTLRMGIDISIENGYCMVDTPRLKIKHTPWRRRHE